MRLASLAATLLVTMSAHAENNLRLYAAGSLRAAFTELVAAFRAKTGTQVAATFGASGLLRERIEKGESADVFASANMQHPRSLEQAGRAGPVRAFARNRLCALARPELRVDSDTLLERMLDPAVKLGTSTPTADPSGDYAFELFAKADGARPGARAKLERKALKLTGGPDAPPQAPTGRSLYALLLAEHKADLFLTYCTNAVEARSENASLQVVQIPPPLAVGAVYGLVVMRGARPGAQGFASFVLSPEAQRILASHGFDAPR
jgi:ABC-type molybdate transport system substrate-binding protein